MAVLAEYLIGIIFILSLAIFAFKREALTENGTLAAIIVGLLVFVFPVGPITGHIWFALLVVFFLASFFVTKYKLASKEHINKQFAKGATRDLMQVFANGAGAALLAVVYHFYPQETVFVAFATVLATVNADTWATELGILSKYKPFLVTTLKRVEAGISGAVSLSGFLAALIGAAIIGLTAVLLFQVDNVYFNSTITVPGGVVFFVFITTFFGVVGSLIDSFLGATLQVMYYCKKCKRETERVVHTCGTRTTYLKGLKFFDNDVVNLVASLIAGGLAFATYTGFALRLL